jgi:hypothetical protein
LGVCQSQLIGGAFIHLIGLLVAKAIGRPATTGSDDALNQLALASTVWLIVCCAMAYGLFLLRPACFFPAMTATNGSRYLIFASVFGRQVFRVLGMTFVGTAHLVFFAWLTPSVAAGIGGLIEVLCASFVFTKPFRPSH